MGTRSITVFQDEKGSELVVLYRQFDGYPSAHGAELAAVLSGAVMVNGIPGGKQRVFNGLGDLAVRCIAGLKTGQGESKARFAKVMADADLPAPSAESRGLAVWDEPGGFYLYPAGTRDVGEDYIYVVTCGELGGAPTLAVRRWRREDKTFMRIGEVTCWSGPPDTFIADEVEAAVNKAMGWDD